MLKLVSNKIDTYLTSLWRYERYLFFVFRGILPAIFRRFLKKLSTSASCTRNIFYQIIKINKTQILLKYFFGARGVKFLEKWRENVQILKDEVLLTVSCSIFPSILIAKNLLTGSLKNRSIDNLETQKQSISMKNTQFFDY
jgi:hypothetical protein